ncbi:MAG: 2-dehydro-3-deoxygluconokinase [Rhodothermales bacterium]|jgi:2-dehydro-3-deoxygluconokinase
MKVVTFGEIMLRLSPPGFSRFVQAKSLDVNFGGGEANVAVALAHFGLDAHFVTKLPAHEIGQAAVNSLRGYGVNTQFVVRGGDRVGIYFLETGASQRGSKVIYDRAQSAVTTLRPEELDWEEVFDGARWFHWTGITPALGPQATETLKAAISAARAAGATISCDLNFRKKLWTQEEAQATMRPLMEFVDVCIANEEDAEKCLGITAPSSNVETGHLEEAEYGQVARTLKETFGFDSVAITLRESISASTNGWSAILLDTADCPQPARSIRYEIQLVDRVGGGDAFASGLIAGLLQKGSTRDALEFAVAASCLKQTIPGDVNLVSAEEVDKLIAGGGSGRVDR